jgi:3-hydroxyacyl-CoA dehydrogenase/enoyl-CoA hydratase/3-hydroxybutyryl-CoA epimerase
VERGYRDGFEAGLREEAIRFGELTVSPECKQLVYLFFATNALKKDSGLPKAGRVRARHHETRNPWRGFMGAGIASVAVQAGSLVRFKDASLERLANGWRAVREVVRERQKRRQITRLQMDDFMSQVV